MRGMGVTLAISFWTVAGIYLAIGLLFAVPFVIRWAGRLDPAAEKGTWGFRMAILPGVAALWPLLLLKMLRSRRDQPAPPDTGQVATAAGLRRMHGVAIVLLAVIVPVVCVGALMGRPRERHSTVTQLQTRPLPQVISLPTAWPEALPITASLRTDGTRSQLQMDVTQPLEDPVVALYWSPGKNESGVTKDAVFLGSLWGPSTLLFELPEKARTQPGYLTLLALAGEQRVIGSLPLPAK